MKTKSEGETLLNLDKMIDPNLVAMAMSSHMTEQLIHQIVLTKFGHDCLNSIIKFKVTVGTLCPP